VALSSHPMRIASAAFALTLGLGSCATSTRTADSPSSAQSATTATVNRDRSRRRSRSFSADEETAAAAGLAFAAGLEAGGVVPVVKHFPGLGGATGNTDVSAASTVPWSQLRTVGFVAFENAVNAHVPAIMIANATVPGLSTLSASISPSVISGVLRAQLGYRRLVLTDSLSAVALTGAGYTVPRAARAALVAGADVIPFGPDTTSAASDTANTVAAIVSAVRNGELRRALGERGAAHPRRDTGRFLLGMIPASASRRRQLWLASSAGCPRWGKALCGTMRCGRHWRYWVSSSAGLGRLTMFP
jgi:beta-glucosidase-like glycosyl hydrolase